MPDSARQWYEMVRAEARDTAVIRIFGDIGESWWGDSVSAARFAQELDDLGGVSALEIRLNSPGGDMFDGVAIFNTLRNHSARKTVFVDGLAASAASVVAMAADELVMGTGTQLMIHDAWSMFMGNADDARKQADVLDQLSGSMAEIYADRAGGKASEWRASMREETWYGADEAVSAGLADRVVRRESAETPDDAAVAAMLRQSKVAAKFRYLGRAHAPAPRTAVHEDGNTTKGGSVEITDEDFATLRTSLGLGDDAEIGDVIDAAADRKAPTEEKDEAPEPVAAKLPEGVLAIDSETWAQVQADAKLGREAREAQVQARQVALVDAAVKAGKIMPSRKVHWLSQLQHDEEGVTAAIAALTPVFSTAEVGYDDGSPDEDGPLVNFADPKAIEEVRQTALYQGWKVN